LLEYKTNAEDVGNDLLDRVYHLEDELNNIKTINRFQYIDDEPSGFGTSDPDKHMTSGLNKMDDDVEINSSEIYKDNNTSFYGENPSLKNTPYATPYSTRFDDKEHNPPNNLMSVSNWMMKATPTQTPRQTQQAPPSLINPSELLNNKIHRKKRFKIVVEDSEPGSVAKAEGGFDKTIGSDAKNKEYDKISNKERCRRKFFDVREDEEVYSKLKTLNTKYERSYHYKRDEVERDYKFLARELND
jgi:hypothetical protein